MSNLNDLATTSNEELFGLNDPETIQYVERMTNSLRDTDEPIPFDALFNAGWEQFEGNSTTSGDTFDAARTLQILKNLTETESSISDKQKSAYLIQIEGGFTQLRAITVFMKSIEERMK